MTALTWWMSGVCAGAAMTLTLELGLTGPNVVVWLVALWLGIKAFCTFRRWEEPERCPGVEEMR